MTINCEDHRRRILADSLHELSSDERQALEFHLVNCASCAEEHRLTFDTLQQLNSEDDAAVPRHFFVTNQETSSTPWTLFQQMSWSWKAISAAAVLAMAVVAVATISGVEVHRQANGITLSLGQSSEVRTRLPETTLNVDQFKTEILQAVEAKSHEDRLAWMNSMRHETAFSAQKLNQKQRKLLASALADFETRVDERMSAQELSTQANWKQALGDLYKTIQLQRKQDFMVTRSGIERLAAQGEVRTNETEAILATLLQAAEYRMK